MPKVWRMLRRFPDCLFATLSNRLLLFCLTGFVGFHPCCEVGAQESQNVPKGTLHHGLWNSEQYQGTTRDYWVYVPASHQGLASFCLMVFNDGRSYMSEQGAFRVPEVMDRLIHQKAMPATIAIFINPGEIPSSEPGKAPGKTGVLNTMPWVTVMPDSSWKSFFLLLKLNIPFQKSQSIVPSVASVRGALVPLRLLGNILKHSERCSVISEVLSISEVGMLIPISSGKPKKEASENISSGRSTRFGQRPWPLATSEQGNGSSS